MCLHLPVAIIMSSSTASSPPSSSPGDAEPGIRHMGTDERGWFIIDVDAYPGDKIFEVTIGKKKVVLVAQTVPMRVYVSPAPAAFDEWEIHGERHLVGSPK